MSPWKRLFSSVLLTAVCVIGAAPPKPTRVEVWIGSDDGLTIRLRDALESAFKSSSDFALSFGKKPGTLLATIPDGVEWKKSFGRTKVLYTVKFTSVEDHNLGASSGSCWESTLQKCAARIVIDAKAAAERMQ
jgi:hypothetical protein